MSLYGLTALAAYELLPGAGVQAAMSLSTVLWGVLFALFGRRVRARLNAHYGEEYAKAREAKSGAAVRRLIPWTSALYNAMLLGIGVWLLSTGTPLYGWFLAAGVAGFVAALVDIATRAYFTYRANLLDDAAGVPVPQSAPWYSAWDIVFCLAGADAFVVGLEGSSPTLTGLQLLTLCAGAAVVGVAAARLPDVIKARATSGPPTAAGTVLGGMPGPVRRARRLARLTGARTLAVGAAGAGLLVQGLAGATGLGPWYGIVFLAMAVVDYLSSYRPALRQYQRQLVDAANGEAGASPAEDGRGGAGRTR